MSLFGINKWHIETSLDMMNDGNSQKEIETKTREDIGEMKKWVEKELSVKSKYSKEYGDLLSKWLETYKTKIQKDTQNQVAGVKDNISGNKPGNNKGGNETSEGGESPASKPDSKKPEQNNTSEGILELGENESITIGDKTIKKGQGVTYNLNESGSFTGKYKKDGDKVGEIEIEKSGSKQKVFIKVKEINSYIEKNAPSPNNKTNNTKPSAESKTPDNKETSKETETQANTVTSFSTTPNAGETKLSSKDGKSILVGTFDSSNRLYNGREIVKGEKVMRVFENGKHKYTYEGEFKNGKFNGIIRYFDGTKRVDIVENGERQDYTVEFYAGLAGLLAVSSGAYAVGGIGGVIFGAGYSIIDLLNQDEDILWDILKSLPAPYKTTSGKIVDPRFEGGGKTWIDNAIAVIGIIPGIRQATLGAKIAKYTSKLKPSELSKFEKIKEAVIAKVTGKGKVSKTGETIETGTKAKITKGVSNTTEQSVKSATDVGKVTETGNDISKAGKAETGVAENITTNTPLTGSLNSQFKRLFSQQLEKAGAEIEVGSVRIKKVVEGGETRYLYNGTKYSKSGILKEIKDNDKIAFLRKNADEAIGKIKGTQNVGLDGIPGFRNIRVVNGKVERKVSGNWKVLEGEELTKVRGEILSDPSNLRKLLNKHIPNFETDVMTVRQKLLNYIKNSGIGKKDEEFSKWIKERGWLSLSTTLQPYRALSLVFRKAGTSLTRPLDIASAGNHAIQGKIGEGAKILFTGDKHATFGQILKSAGMFGGSYAAGMTMYEILTQSETHNGGSEILGGIAKLWGGEEDYAIMKLVTPSELFSNYRDFILFGAIWPILWEIYGNNNEKNKSINARNESSTQPDESEPNPDEPPQDEQQSDTPPTDTEPPAADESNQPPSDSPNNSSNGSSQGGATPKAKPEEKDDKNVIGGLDTNPLPEEIVT